MKIVEFAQYSERTLAEVSALMSQLSPDSTCTQQQLQRVLDSPDVHLYVVCEEERIVASACLCVCPTTEFTLGFVEAVVVSAECRGRGYGKKLMQYLIEQAKLLGVNSLHLTSNPTRQAANALYQNLGFSRKETNCYVLNLA